MLNAATFQIDKLGLEIDYTSYVPGAQPEYDHHYDRIYNENNNGGPNSPTAAETAGFTTVRWYAMFRWGVIYDFSRCLQKRLNSDLATVLSSRILLLVSSI